MTTATDIVLLKNSVIALLRSHAVQRIQFVAESVKINHQLYIEMARLVEAGRIQIDVDPRLADEKVGGRYHATANPRSLTLWTAQLATSRDKGIVVHELTHAALDSLALTQRRGLHVTENESIAFIASQVYLRHVHGRALPSNSPRPFLVADAIASKIVAAGPHLYYLTQEDIRSIRNAIGQHPHYRKIRGHVYTSGGIP
jgi:hypothetical protein